MNRTRPDGGGRLVLTEHGWLLANEVVLDLPR
jgi:hypothetical protein